MRVVFRVDSSSLIGTGHLVRCLTLANALRERGAEVEFISREHPGNLLARLAAEGFATTTLPAPAAKADPSSESNAEDYAAWLGVPAAEDAAQTIEALDAAAPDWLVVDHYGLDSEWETRLRPHVGRILAIDDLANRTHDCDVLLDQNYFADPESRYRGLVPPGCRFLVGPRYALLRPEYREYRAKPHGPDGEVRRVLVFLGGTDRHGVTAMALEALSAPGLAHLHVDVVVGANNASPERIEELAVQRGRTTLETPRPHLADLMWRADVAIGAGGATTWERMCIGLPSVTMSVAENQRPGCEALARAGLIGYGGHVAQFGVEDLRRALDDLIRDGARLSKLRRENRGLVDGCGAMRVTEALL